MCSMQVTLHRKNLGILEERLVQIETLFRVVNGTSRITAKVALFLDKHDQYSTGRLERMSMEQRMEMLFL